MNKNTIIVTGGAGFVGSNLIELLIKKTKYKIISIDDYSSGTKKNHLKNSRIKYLKSHTKNIFKNFIQGVYRIIISTDIWSRGIDINTVGFVINFDLPFKKESYIHRIGRSGRYGKKGVAINFINDNEYNQMKKIEEFYSTNILEMPINIESYI